LGESVLADSHTLETLDFASVRERMRSLTQTQRGAMLATDLQPFVDFERVRREQALTAATRDLIASADFFVQRCVDTAPFSGAASRGKSLSGTELRELVAAIAAAAAAFNKVRASESQLLATLTTEYRPLNEVARAISEAIDERGLVLDRASPQLGRIRRNLKSAHTEARDRVASILRGPKYAAAIQDAVVTIREGRFVVPIKAEFGGEFPGIVHDTSSSGQTLFVEPLAALETNNRLRTLRLQEEREVQRVLGELSSLAGSQAQQIESNVSMLAGLDVLVAKAQLAIAMRATDPQLVDSAAIDIIEGHHPLLGERAVPQSLSLGDSARVMVISGPNMGGKTVALKMVGLFVSMTYCGLQIPAAPGSCIGRFERIFSDIGDEQSIAENASTFSAHLQRMREILAGANERSLVLVDEIGGGTEPSSGAALAIAMLERLIVVRACAIVTTHATELKLFAHATAGITNASVRFDPNTFAPTYQLDVGTPGQSLAFPLARAMGIRADVLARAETLLGQRERDYERALADLSAVHAQLAAEKEKAVLENVHLQTLQDKARKRSEALEKERREFAARAEDRMRGALTDFSAELQRRADANVRAKVTPAQSALLSNVLDELHRDLGILPQIDGQDVSDRRFEQGASVHLDSLGQDATVIADNGDRLLVAIGPMRTTVAKRDARAIGSSKRAPQGGSADANLAAATSAVAEVDVRGMRFVEAEPVVERWIDEALLAGHSPLRLIHGKGSGLLGRGLQEYLRAHHAVTNVRYGNEDEGGSGVTVFELR